MQRESIQTSSTQSQRDFLPRIGAGCLVLLGAMILAISATFVFTPQAFDIPGFVFYGLIGVGFGVSGVFWFRYISALEATRRTHFAEKEVLRAAQQSSGRITLAQLTLQTPLSSDDVQHALDHLCARGVAWIELQDDGTVEYRFRGLLKE